MRWLILFTKLKIEVDKPNERVIYLNNLFKGKKGHVILLAAYIKVIILSKYYEVAYRPIKEEVRNNIYV